MTRKQAAAIRRWHDKDYGPQVPGGTYHCGYWRQDYTVEAMWSDRAGAWQHTAFMRVRWADGHVTEHCTAWDARRDRIVRQPPERAREAVPARPR